MGGDKGAQVKIWLWDSTNEVYVPAICDSSGRLKVVAQVDELDDIGDVYVPSPTDLYILYWNNTNSRWECRAFTDWLHASAHQNGGADEISVAGLSGELADDQPPKAHASDHQNGGADEINIAGLSGVSAELATHAADIDAHMPDIQQVLTIGQYYWGSAVVGYVGSSVVPTDVICAVPIFFPRAVTIDQLVISVDTAEAGKNARLGLYEDDGSGYPGDLVVDGGAVSLAATGIVAATISESLAAGLYWGALVSDATGTAKVVRVSSGAIALGCRSPDLAAYYCYYKAQSYGAMPDPFPSSATIYTGARAFKVLPRPASMD